MRLLDWILIISIGLLWLMPTLTELSKLYKFKLLKKIAIRNQRKGKVRKKKNKRKK